MKPLPRPSQALLWLCKGLFGVVCLVFILAWMLLRWAWGLVWRGKK